MFRELPHCAAKTVVNGDSHVLRTEYTKKDRLRDTMMKPKFFSIIKHRKEELSPQQIKNDVIAGIIVAIIALPLSVALAIASGVTPEKGLVTAIIAGFLISLLGGSRVQIGGPTGAFVVIIAGIIGQYGIAGLTVATIMAGVFMILMGVLKFGSIIKFIPYPTTTGFTAGIAVVLLSTQIKDFFGLTIDSVPSEFLGKWEAYFQHFSTINWTTTIVGIVSILIIVFWPKVNKSIPGTLVALVGVTGVVTIFQLPVETIGSRFGTISSQMSLVDFSSFHMSWSDMSQLLRPAFTIAFLASIESLLSAVVADGMIGKKHNSNMELIAQGIANIASALFGGIPATGAIARTAANVKNGGRTPIAGMVHGVTLLLIMMIFMPLAKLIPMTTLAAILAVVAYNMSEWRSFKSILSSTKSDITVLLVTFFLTIVFDLVVAIEIGMVIAMFLFIRRLSCEKLVDHVSTGSEILGEDEEDEDYGPAERNSREKLDDGIMVYEINGPLFFGVANSFLDVIAELKNTTKVLVFRMEHVPSMDATALRTMRQLHTRCQMQRILLLYSNLQHQPKELLEKSGYVEFVGADRFFETTEDAVHQGHDILALDLQVKKKKHNHV